MTSIVTAAGVRCDHFSWREAIRGQLILDDVTLQVRAGEAILITGPSGSGKSTLVHAMAGLLHSDDGETAGSVVVESRADGRETVVGVVFQQPDDQTILHRLGDDVAFGLENTGVDPSLMPERVAQALASVGLDLPTNHLTEQLSGGQRQRLALAGALAMDPGVLILDEPLQALDGVGKKQVLDAVATLRHTHPFTLIVVDHEPTPWLPLVDRVVTLGTGRIVDVVSAGTVKRTPRLDMVGLAPSSSGNTTEVVCEASGLVIGRGAEPLLGQHTLAIRAGEVVALTGPNGVGKTTLALTLAGIIPPRGGVLVGAHIRPGLTSVERSRLAAYVPHNPALHHVAKTVVDDLSLSPRAHGLNTSDANNRARQWGERLGVSHLLHRHPQGLSGGEKRRVAIAAALTQQSQLVIFDEPTQSLDDASWVSFVGLVRELAASGVAVIIVTHDAELIDAVGARVYEVGSAPAPPAITVPDHRATWLRDANPLALIGAAAAIALGLIVTLDVVSAGVAVGIIALLTLTTGLSLSRVVTRLIPIGLAAVFSGITIALYGQESGQVFVSWGLVVVSEGSLELALATFLRILAIATPAVVLLAGVDATKLADGLAQLWRVPERFVLGALSGIRLVQLLGGDIAVLRQTRASRGVGDVAWWRRLFSEAFTLIVVALRRADTLALAMDSRGFAKTTIRTHYRIATWHTRDTMIVAGGVVVAVLSVGAAIWAGEFNAIIG